MDKTKRTLIPELVIVAVLVAADQYSKHLAVVHLRGKEGIPLIRGVLSLSYVENYGAAFGMLQNMRIAFVIITVVVLCAILYALKLMPAETRYRYLRLTLTLLAAGAAGNLIDRIKSVYVVDFIYFSLIDFPVFNFADIYVTVSAACLFFLMLFYYKDDEFSFLRLPSKGKTQEKDEDA